MYTPYNIKPVKMVLPWPLAEPIDEGFLGASCYDRESGNLIFASTNQPLSQLSFSSARTIQVDKS